MPHFWHLCFCMLVVKLFMFMKSKQKNKQKRSVALSHISDHPEHPYGNVIQKEPPDPLTPCPHWARLACTCTPLIPSRGQSYRSSRSQREASPTTTSSLSPSSGHLPAPDQRLQCCSLWYWQLFYGQSKTTPAGEHVCLITHLTPVCLCVWRCDW